MVPALICLEMVAQCCSQKNYYVLEIEENTAGVSKRTNGMYAVDFNNINGFLALKIPEKEVSKLDW